MQTDDFAGQNEIKSLSGFQKQVNFDTYNKLLDG